MCYSSIPVHAQKQHRAGTKDSIPRFITQNFFSSLFLVDIILLAGWVRDTTALQVSYLQEAGVMLFELIQALIVSKLQVIDFQLNHISFQFQISLPFGRPIPSV
jgi:hypothetical protein